MDVPAAAIPFALVFCGLIVASVWAWLVVALRIAATSRRLSPRLASFSTEFHKTLGLPARLPLVPWSSRRPVPWGLIDLVLLLAIWIVASIIVGQILHHLGLTRPGESMESLALAGRKGVIAGNVLISLSIVAIGLPLIALRTAAGLSDFGWSPAHVISDLRLGCIGFILLAPPVYALQGLLVQFWKPSKHPLIEMFKETPEPLFFVFLFVSAALVAPLFEELMFRVVMQGYFENWCSISVTLRELLVGRDREHPDAAKWSPVAAPAAQPEPPDGTGRSSAAADQDQNPYAPPEFSEAEIVSATMATSSREQAELRGLWAWLPVFICSAVFALMHYSHGPDWVPLFLLACGMGYLYQRTHRLLPSLIIHTLLNAFSLWGLWVQVQSGGG